MARRSERGRRRWSPARFAGAYDLLGVTNIEFIWDVSRELGDEGVRVERDPEEAIAELSGEIQTLILVTDEAHDHVVVLAMPQMCFFRERFTSYPRQLVVRVLDRDCKIE